MAERPTPPVSQRLQRNLPLLAMHVHDAAISHFRPILKHFGLTDQQWRVLRAIWEVPGGMEPGQIAEACKILSPSLTGILSRLRKLDLIKRSWSEIDQRRQIVTLTPRALDLVAQLMPHIDEQYRRIEVSLGADQLALIYTELDRILALLTRPVQRVMDDLVEDKPRRMREMAGSTTRIGDQGPSVPLVLRPTESL